MGTTISKKLFQDDMILVPRKEYERFLRVVKVIPEAQVWFWTSEWQKKEEAAERDIRKGKVSVAYTSGKELLKSLKP